MQSVLVDTCFWLAAFSPRDSWHAKCGEKIDLLDVLKVVVPWPTVYETLRSDFVKYKVPLGQFENYLKRPNIVYVDDRLLRQTAFELSLDSSLRKKRPLSMVDCLIRLMLDDPNVRVSYLATFNERDFADVCTRRNIAFL